MRSKSDYPTKEVLLKDIAERTQRMQEDADEVTLDVAQLSMLEEEGSNDATIH